MSESSELKDAVNSLTQTIEKLRDDLVRKDVYAVDQKLMSARLDNYGDDVRGLLARFDKAEDRRAADRRLILTALVLPVVLIVIQLYLASQTGGAG